MIDPNLLIAICCAVPTLVLVAVAVVAIKKDEVGVAGPCLIVSAFTAILCIGSVLVWNAEVWAERHGKDQPKMEVRR